MWINIVRIRLYIYLELREIDAKDHSNRLIKCDLDLIGFSCLLKSCMFKLVIYSTNFNFLLIFDTNFVKLINIF